MDRNGIRFSVRVAEMRRLPPSGSQETQGERASNQTQYARNHHFPERFQTARTLSLEES